MLVPEWLGGVGLGLSNAGPIDATGEKLAFVGRFEHPERVGKDISRVQLRWGTVTKAGGSGLTISLQDVLLGSGSPMRPDDTQDQTVAVANGDAGFASNTWYRSGALSANRTVAHGALLAVVIEYDGSGRLGADAVNVSCMGGLAAAGERANAATMLKTASWAKSNNFPNVVLECSDGTFGTMHGAFPVKDYNQVTATSTGNPKEIGMEFSWPAPIKIDSVITHANIQSGGDIDWVLYDSSDTVLETVVFDQDTDMGNGFNRHGTWPFSGEKTIAKNGLYYLVGKAVNATGFGLSYLDVDNAAHWELHGIGDNAQWVQRNTVGSGAWTKTATRRPIMGFRISSMDDGAGGGGIIFPTGNALVY